MDWEHCVASKYVRGFTPSSLATGAFLMFLLAVFVFFAVKSWQDFPRVSLAVHVPELVVIITCLTMWCRFETREDIDA
jgi:hypothetical protein